MITSPTDHMKTRKKRCSFRGKALVYSMVMGSGDLNDRTWSYDGKVTALIWSRFIPQLSHKYKPCLHLEVKFGQNNGEDRVSKDPCLPNSLVFPNFISWTPLAINYMTNFR